MTNPVRLKIQIEVTFEKLNKNQKPIIIGNTHSHFPVAFKNEKREVNSINHDCRVRVDRTVATCKGYSILLFQFVDTLKIYRIERSLALYGGHSNISAV